MEKTTTTIDFKSTSFYALKLVLHTADTRLVLSDLQKRINDAGDFYAGEAIVIDISNLDKAPEWPALITTLKDNKLYPIGIQTNANLEADCENSGLAILDIINNRTGDKPVGQPVQKNSENQKKPVDNNGMPQQQSDLTSTDNNKAPRKTMVVNKPLRSGQSIYARNCDLIVIGMVSKGAEIIADGNIHVYGPLRGKAIAGAKGDTEALILTTQLDPELLAIAGVYRVIETDLPNNLHDKAVKVELAGDSLKFQQLK